MPRTPLNSGKNAPVSPPLNFLKSASEVKPGQSKSSPHRASDRTKNTSGSSAISVNELERLAADYLLDCDYQGHSSNTVGTRKIFIRNLIWFLRHRDYVSCGTSEMRQFFAYLRHGHEEPGGRWGNPRWNTPMTIKDYYVNLRCLFNWLVEDGNMEVSPLDAIPKPSAPTEQVQPFTSEQIQSLLKTARRSTQPRRNEAIILFLYDTGVRASELCGLKMHDIDLESRHARVLGKGNKTRMVYFSRETARSLSAYLRKSGRKADAPVFLSRIGNRTGSENKAGEGSGQPMTRSALLHLITNLGRAAGIKAMKVSPHVFRHSAAIQLLRNGCDVYSLMALLGHTSLAICQNYLKLSQTDLENQHRRHSPVESMGKRGGKA